MHKISSLSKLMLLVFALAGLVGCGDKHAADDDKAKTQVVAKVNGDEISVHQLNLQMSRVGQVPEAQVKEVSQQVLERLVDQQLLLQQALSAKLDRDPKVLQALEAARTEILTQAYMDQQLATAKKPTEQEIAEFYAKHPELFEKRRLFRLQEIAVAAGRDKVAEIEAGVRAAKDLNAIGEWLKSKSYQFSASGNVRAAEQLPLELLPRLQQMKDGEIVMIPTDRSINIVMLVASQEQPVDQAKAKPMIEQYFLNQAKGDIAKKELAKLRKDAKIEFVGAFSDMKPRTAAAQPEAATKSAEAKHAESKTAGKTEGADAADIEKGVAGL